MALLMGTGVVFSVYLFYDGFLRTTNNHGLWHIRHWPCEACRTPVALSRTSITGQGIPPSVSSDGDAVCKVLAPQVPISVTKLFSDYTIMSSIPAMCDNDVFGFVARDSALQPFWAVRTVTSSFTLDMSGFQYSNLSVSAKTSDKTWQSLLVVHCTSLLLLPFLFRWFTKYRMFKCECLIPIIHCTIFSRFLLSAVWNVHLRLDVHFLHGTLSQTEISTSVATIKPSC